MRAAQIHGSLQCNMKARKLLLVCVLACVWRSEESLMERILFFTFMWILGLALELRLSGLHSSTELSHWPAYFNLRNMFYPYIKTTH